MGRLHSTWSYSILHSAASSTSALFMKSTFWLQFKVRKEGGEGEEGFDDSTLTIKTKINNFTCT
jgi:hypothetical protein